MQSSEVELYTGGVERSYRSLGMIEAKRSKRSALSQDPTLEEVNSELRQKAAELGANAVLRVDYKRGMSLTSYGVLTARGEAVLIVADTKVCPVCAETIKNAAVKCRFCGAELQA